MNRRAFLRFAALAPGAVPLAACAAAAPENVSVTVNTSVRSHGADPSTLKAIYRAIREYNRRHHGVRS